ncbi:MAG: L,D-transpeptidase family protein, partial [Clostridiales bacterium]|nr:L,D-transpeptidase family protein [Clostridiales bacterium]
DIGEIFRLQNQLLWPVMLFKRSDYNIKDLLLFDEALLRERIDHLDCLNKAVIEPRDVSFVYKNGAYIMQKEIAGNKLNKERVNELINKSIQAGIAELDLEKEDCYYKPRFTHKDKKALDCLNTLNKYASAWIKYKFENRYELVDGNVISRWLIVDDRLDVSINRKAVRDYIKWLVNKYDTVGISRSFKSSTGRTLEVTGGLYGWKIDQEAEIKALIKNIEQADKIIKEPVYEQKAVSRGEDDIGNSYIEINITRQYLWFYKDGRCIAQGAVVTGNPNKGNATVTGTYFIVYKERDSVLTGPGYEAKVSYWMPFFGNMGLHDARWRSAFGGEIYKRNGTHGCVNAPVGLAKKIFENIEEGIPVIIYEEKKEQE